MSTSPARSGDTGLLPNDCMQSLLLRAVRFCRILLPSKPRPPDCTGLLPNQDPLALQATPTWLYAVTTAEGCQVLHANKGLLLTSSWDHTVITFYRAVKVALKIAQHCCWYERDYCVSAWKTCSAPFTCYFYFLRSTIRKNITRSFEIHQMYFSTTLIFTCFS